MAKIETTARTSLFAPSSCWGIAVAVKSSPSSFVFIYGLSLIRESKMLPPNKQARIMYANNKKFLTT
jgi:hypothetical protein